MDSSPMGSWPSNPSFNWRIQANQIKEVFGSGAGAMGWPPRGWGPAPLPNILQPIVEFPNQMMNSTPGKGKIQWNIQSAIDFKLLRKVKTDLVNIVAYRSHDSTGYLNL